MALWKADPVEFVRDQFKVEPDLWQADVLRAFPHNNRLAMKACKGPGKTTVLAWLSWNFLATRPHPKVIGTSITGDNLSDGLWTEMARWQKESEFLKNSFQWNKQSIVSKDHSQTWWMVARTWVKGADKTAQADTLAGKHADYMMFVLDEVGGIPDAVMAAAEASLATGIESKLVIAGNPTHNEGPLFRACTSERTLWHLTEISSAPNDPKRTPRVSAKWAQEQIDKYGEDNPWVLVNVFGKFPPSSLNALIGPDEVREAMKRHVDKSVFEHAQRRLGVDVARFGDDSTVLFPRQGLVAFAPVEMRNASTTDIASRIALAKSRWNSELEFVDGTGGYGAGVVDTLLQRGHSPMEVNFQGRADDSRYFNKRAEMWYRMVEWIKRGGVLPKDEQLLKELTAPLYFFSASGKIQIEDKAQIKTRLGFSPDKADALALTFAMAETPGGLSSALASMGLGPLALGANKHQFEWNPFDGEDRMTGVGRSLDGD